MGGRKKRRRVIRRKKRRIPKIFICPRCGKQSVTVNFSEEEGVRQATVRCASCGLEASFPVKRIYEAVDAYTMFSDLYYEGRIS